MPSESRVIYLSEFLTMFMIFHSGIPILENYLEEIVKKNIETALRNNNVQYSLIYNSQNLEANFEI